MRWVCIQVRVRIFTLELSTVGLYTSEGEDFYPGTEGGGSVYK